MAKDVTKSTYTYECGKSKVTLVSPEKKGSLRKNNSLDCLRIVYNQNAVT
jgi:hypothetical protein